MKKTKSPKSPSIKEFEIALASPWGAAERKVPLNQINIPDLFDIANFFPGNSKKYGMILNCCLLAHDLLRQVQRDHPDSTILMGPTKEFYNHFI